MKRAQNHNHLNQILAALLSLFLMVEVSGLAFAQNQAAPSQPIFRQIPNNAIVEGSSRYGGLQPDYLIDGDSPEFAKLWALSERLKKDTQKSVPEKVSILVKEVHKMLSQHHEYRDPVYLDLMEKYRKKGVPIPLSEYVSHNAGVCRENAIITHLALKRAGIANSHVYAYTIENLPTGPVPGDHGFVVFHHKGERWIADSYFKEYNGYSFDEFVENLGKERVPKRRLFFAEPMTNKRAIIRFNDYPKVHPAIRPEPCQKSYSNLDNQAPH